MIIGLTGNIATDKSTVMSLAVQHGAYTIDADQVVHDVYATDQALLAELRTLFGNGIFFDDGSLNRKALGVIVFTDKAAMKRLEAAVHPAVRREVRQRIDNAKSNIIMLEAIKLLESPIGQLADRVWVTNCSAERQIQRLITHRGLTQSEAEQRVNAQAPQAEKLARADVIIDTNGTMEQTIAQFEQAWATLETNNDL